METKIYVGNLSYDTTEDDIRSLFAQAGTVTSVALIKDRDTGQSKGFAFVEMSNQSEAEKAIQTFNGYTLGNRPLKVNMARPREERGFGGGGGGGYGDRRGGGGGYNRGGPGGGRGGPGGKSRGGQRRY
jgi:RNA recognition motif-containing protein